MVRNLPIIALAALLVACAPAPPPQQGPVDLTKEGWYDIVTRQLADVVKQGEDDFRAGRFDDVAKLIERGQPLQARLLGASQPTLAAMEAASDLDDLYGRMLVRNGRHGWARTFFQNNVIRWKNWKPQTPETERRRKAALEAVALCDRSL